MSIGGLPHRPRVAAFLAAEHLADQAHLQKEGVVGKGDKKTRKGKLYRGTFGKRRPKKSKKKRKGKAKPEEE